MRDSLQLRGSCREGTPLLIHVCFSVSTLSPLRFPGPRGLSSANGDVTEPTCSAPCRERFSQSNYGRRREDLAKVSIDASRLQAMG
jgi:hypothetical protein